MMKTIALALAASILAVPALASATKESSFTELATHVFDEGGVRVSSCHLEWQNVTGLAAVPKCYVLNASGKIALARIEFSALDKDGAPIISTTLPAWPLRDMNGAEFLQSIPITPEEQARVKRARVRVIISGG